MMTPIEIRLGCTRYVIKINVLTLIIGSSVNSCLKVLRAFGKKNSITLMYGNQQYDTKVLLRHFLVGVYAFGNRDPKEV